MAVEQTSDLIRVILNQNSFQYNAKYFKPTKGSPISSTLADVYLQLFEELTIGHWMESGGISYHKRYVNILIVSDQNKTNENSITNYMNNIHYHYQFKLTEEQNNINYLDLSIHRHSSSLYLRIYGKPTQTDNTIHFTPTYPLEHKLAAYIFHINRMVTLPITEQTKQQE
jgi:hypothetical protein